ncbi:hypothetical protein D3C75_1124300 [compost metagenome]
MFHFSITKNATPTNISIIATTLLLKKREFNSSDHNTPTIPAGIDAITILTHIFIFSLSNLKPPFTSKGTRSLK